MTLTDGRNTSGAGAAAIVDAGHVQPDSAMPIDAGATSLSAFLTEERFDALFPHRTDPACSGAPFTRATLIEAAADFPAFANEGSTDVQKRELAAFFANVSHETTGGWPTAPDGPQAWGLCYRQELGCENGACTQYCDASNQQYPCVAGKTYQGRGPIQLSWNYNYGQAGAALGLDLLHQPEQVADDGVVAWKTALWFWMTAQAPKPSAHAVMTGSYVPSAADLAAGRVAGFGLTIDIINGNLECDQATDARVEDRVAFYQRYTSMFGVTPGDALYCDTMRAF
jgi:hypothetical protein